ncbi:proline racemase family protein [Aureibacter tunicatorum]|uniref:Trans-L-3-hydroxyproline dehydratase n=1 Tax=Aureibacter tunicatorum TaxID=866807 RepID=A0AAE3XQP4_9BACT|nr:proline racemase family protein [Aureibacter tunicatorum]MDR6240890.1 trans-L-3-hydroxyproline dehydratase [Aureibacter tunicatorum]BDD03670.1 proline racemase [Aureibacter tunicatorum]
MADNQTIAYKGATTELFEGWDWRPSEDWMTIRTIDLHTGGEPLRVYIDGLPEIKGETVLERRRYFRDNLDFIRTGTMWEPRGHADMYGAVIVPANTPDGDFGTFFLHNEGYSTMCGHAMIALVTLVLDTGMIKKEGDNPVIKIDCPCGRITATAKIGEDGKVKKVSFLNVPSFMPLKDQEVEVPGLGKVKFDLGYGGAFYAYVQAADLGLKLTGEDHDRLVDYGRRIKYAVMENFEIKHPFEEDLSFLYGTIFIGDAHEESHHSRNVCIFAEGEVDRSPTGSGVSGRAAIHYAKGEIAHGEEITIESILGTLMDVEVVEETKYGPFDAIIPKVSGTAAIVGRNEFFFDPKDALKDGFILR